MPQPAAGTTVVGPATPAPNAGATFRQRANRPNVTPMPSPSTGGSASAIQKLQQLLPGISLPGYRAAGSTAPQFSPAGLPLDSHPPSSTITLFAKGAKPTGKSVAATYNQIPHSVDNPTDPYIVAQAQALNNDAGQIFNFVRDQIGFLVYPGSLQGARGTLWTGAGNSLDKSSLLVALLGAAGVQNVMYVQGTLQPSQQQQLILSMFTLPASVAGCPPAGHATGDPGQRPYLAAGPFGTLVGQRQRPRGRSQLRRLAAGDGVRNSVRANGPGALQ